MFQRARSGTYDKDGDEASQSSVPVSVTGRLSNEHAVEYKIAKTQLDAALLLSDRHLPLRFSCAIILLPSRAVLPERE